MADTTESQEKPKVLVTHSEVPEAGLKILRQKCEVIITEDLPTPSKLEILKHIKGVDAIFWVSHEQLDSEVLDAAGPQLKTISTMSAGLDNVDCAAVFARNITLGHTPMILNDAVADQGIGLMIAAGRRFQEGRRKIERNEWENRPQWLLGQDIKGSTVGIVGFGGIGQTIAKRLKGFNVAKILYSGHKEKPEAKELKAEFVTFDELITKSDFVFICVPLTNETRGMFNIEVFKKMKTTSVLINIARGPIVNTDDLVTALSSGLIFSAGLDVLDPEPIPSTHKILTLDNCVVVPHLGSATVRTRSDMSIIAAHNILRGLVGEPMLSPVLKLTQSNFRKPKVLVTHSEVPEVALTILRQKCEVIITEGFPTPSRINVLKLVKGVDAIFWKSTERLDIEILDAAGPQLKTISTMSAGLDKVDCAAVFARNITLGHTPIVLNDAVADDAIGLMIAASRRFQEGRRKIERNEWENRPQWLLGQDIKGSTVGIVGLGGIGQTIAKRLKGFDVAEIVYSGHKEKPEAKELQAEFVTFDELITKSDFIFISAPLTNKTRGLFNIEVFKKMKRTSVLINIARGAIVNTDDLVTALSSGLIFSAGLDVLDPEPIPNNHIILTLDNCVVIPHLGTATIHTRSDMAVMAAHNILRGLFGEPMLSPVLKC